MKLVIIEDEYHAHQHLVSLIKEIEPQAEILEILDSVEDAVTWFRHHPQPDLIFMDIQLADGLSFEIFGQVDLAAPVIFTTAFDQYTLKAFKVNSVDYLLKPVEPAELRAAINKFGEVYQTAVPAFDQGAMQRLFDNLRAKNTFRSRFLIKKGQTWQSVPVEEIAHLYSEDGLTFAMDRQKRRYQLDLSLEKLQDELDPHRFFRINRKQIVAFSSIEKIHSWFNHRMKVNLQPQEPFESIVSRDKVKHFKEWLDR